MIATEQTWSLQGLKALPPPEPHWREAGYWHPVAHYDLLDEVRRQTLDLGWKVGNPTVHVGNRPYKGSTFTGAMAASMTMRVPGTEAPKGASLSLGMVNRNTFPRKLELYGGVQWQLDWVSFTRYPLAWKVRGQGALDLAGAVKKGLARLSRDVRWFGREVERLAETMFGRGEASLHLALAVDQGLLPWNQVGRVLTLFEQNGRTAWGLLAAFARVNCSRPPARQMGNCVSFARMLEVGRCARKGS